MTTTSTMGGTSQVRLRASRPARELAQLDAALGALDIAEQMLARAEELRGTDPRGAFELAHRAALRAAGVVIDQANRDRKRRLPLNVWKALERLGGMHRAWAEETAPMVAERARLDRSEHAAVDLGLLASHIARTRTRIDAVRAEVTIALLPGVAVGSAGTSMR